MPYTNISEVPDYVPKEKRKQWLDVFNSAYAAAIKDGKSKEDAEQTAYAEANGVAGPNAKVAVPRISKAVGTKETGFVRKIDGPFRCGHCEHMEKAAGKAGVCVLAEVNADPELKDEPRGDGGFLIVNGGDCCNEYDPIQKAASGGLRKGDGAMKGKTFSKFIPFAKVDEAKREVWGIVTAEAPDKEFEVCDYEKTVPYYRAVIEEMSKATGGENYFPLRYMHQLDAIGKCLGFDFRDAEKEIFMGFKVVDDQKWKLVMEKVLTGFSHGGTIVGPMVKDPTFEGCMRYVANPSEVSLVDNPCLAEAHFTLVRASGAVELCKFGKVIPFVKPETDRITRLERELATIKATMVHAVKKGKTKRVAGEDLPASAFLIVGDANDTSTWKLPVKFSTDAKTKSHLRNALARFNQLKGVSADEKAAGWKKLVAMCKEYGIEVSDEQSKIKAIAAYVRKVVRVKVAAIARKCAGGNPGEMLGMVDDDLGRLAKGMWEVGRLACLIDDLNCMLYCVMAEQQWEGDEDSPLPGLMAENLDSMLDTLLAMVEEETSELRDDVQDRVG